MGTGFAKKKKQAKELQEKFASMQSSLKNTEMTGQAGNGLVKITLNGEGDMRSIQISPDCVDKEDIDGLQDLIKAAFQDAFKKIREQSDSSMPDLSGFPGLGNLGL